MLNLVKLQNNLKNMQIKLKRYQNYYFKGVIQNIKNLMKNYYKIVRRKVKLKKNIMKTKKK